jgi:hypothetical protein
MNMPPLPYLSRISGLPVAACRSCYTDPDVWNSITPGLITMCSADPQAFRPSGEKVNVVQVGLPTNFKAARFESDAHTSLLRNLGRDIEAARLPGTGDGIELPVKLKVHDSVFVPLAKWPMLLTGNYRSVGPDFICSIQEAVHSDLTLSRSIYDWVAGLCLALGAKEQDLVPFDKYAAAANGLSNPSSAARALYGGATDIERTDRLVWTLARQNGLQSAAIDMIVATVDARLEANRRKS